MACCRVQESNAGGWENDRLCGFILLCPLRNDVGSEDIMIYVDVLSVPCQPHRLQFQNCCFWDGQAMTSYAPISVQTAPKEYKAAGSL